MHNSITDDNILRKQIDAITSIIADGIFTIDQKGTILSANDRAAEIFKTSKVELRKKQVLDLFAPAEATFEKKYLSANHQSSVLRVLNRVQILNGLRTSGETFPFRLSVKDVGSTEKSLYTCVVHDLSEYQKSRDRIIQLHDKIKKQNEELEEAVSQRTNQLEQSVKDLAIANRKLELEIKEREQIALSLQKREIQLERLLSRERELGELKSRFVSMASHEFRTPLTTMLSSVEIIEMALDNPPELVNKHTRRIREGIGYLRNVLEDFLQLGKLDVQGTDMHIQDFELNSFLHQLIEDLNLMCKPGQDIELQLTDQPIMLHNSVNGLRIVLTNLITNAIKYSDDGSAIDVEVVATEDQITYTVKDEGMGIPENEIPFLFERFYRASNVETIKGTGLGLHIISRYVKAMNGDIQVESESGIGSKFIVSIPKNLTINR